MAEHEHNESCKKMFALLSEYLDLELPETGLAQHGVAPESTRNSPKDHADA